MNKNIFNRIPIPRFLILVFHSSGIYAAVNEVPFPPLGHLRKSQLFVNVGIKSQFAFIFSFKIELIAKLL